MIELETFLESIRDYLKNNFFILFKEETVPVALAVLLIVLGFLCLIYLVLIKWLPIRVRLARVEAVVRKSDGDLGFVQQYSTIDRAVCKIRYLRHGWKEFEKSLVMPEDVNSEPIRNTERPNVYLNLTSAETAGIRIRFMQAVPNYFVGFGLLFTFLGLVAAIFFASEGIASAADSGNVRDTQESLRNLLNAATFKFLTSVAGITSSLVVAITYRLVTGSIHHRFDSLCAAVEERMRFVTPEEIAFKQYRELQKQTTQLERFNTDLAVQIADSLDKKISSSLENAIEPLRQIMNGMVDRLGNMNQDALKQMLEDFTAKLQAGAGTELEALAEKFGESRVALKENTDSFTDQMNSLADQMSNQREAMETASSSLHEVVNSAHTAAAALKDAVTPFSTAANDMSVAAQSITATGESMTTLHQSLKELSDTVRNSTETTAASWEGYEARFAAVDEDLARAVDKFQQSILDQQNSITRFVTELDSQVNQALQHLQAGVSSLEDAIEDLNENLTRLQTN